MAINTWEAVNTWDGGTHTGSGALDAQPAQISGVGSSFTVFTGTGALQAQNSAISGTGAGITVFTGSGALQAQNSTLSGAGLRLVSGTGALQSPDAAVTGSGSVSLPAGWVSVTITSVAASGVIQTTPALEVGDRVDYDASTGVTVHTDGTASHPTNPSASFQARVWDGTEYGAVGTITLEQTAGTATGTGALQAQDAAISGAGPGLAVSIPVIFHHLLRNNSG